MVSVIASSVKNDWHKPCINRRSIKRMSNKLLHKKNEETVQFTKFVVAEFVYFGTEGEKEIRKTIKSRNKGITRK